MSDDWKTPFTLPGSARVLKEGPYDRLADIVRDENTRSVDVVKYNKMDDGTWEIQTISFIYYEDGTMRYFQSSKPLV